MNTQQPVNLATLLGSPEVKITITVETVTIVKLMFGIVAAGLLILIASELFKSK